MRGIIYQTASFIANQDFLGFWMVNIRLRRCTGCTPRKPNTRDEGGDKSQRPCSPNTWSPELLGPGKGTKHRPNRSVLWGLPEYLNLNGLDLGSACNPGPASDSSRQRDLEPKQCRLGKHTRRERGQAQCVRVTARTPHRCQCCLFTAFLHPHSTTEQVSLKKCPPLPPWVRVEISHRRDQQTE